MGRSRGGVAAGRLIGKAELREAGTTMRIIPGSLRFMVPLLLANWGGAVLAEEARAKVFRKVINKYIPPDFDPSQLRRPRKGEKRKRDADVKSRMMLPITVRCKVRGRWGA